MKSFSFQKDLFTDDELWQRERAPKQRAADVSSTLRSKSATEDGSAEPSFFCRQDAGSTLMFTSFLRANLLNALCILVFLLSMLIVHGQERNDRSSWEQSVVTLDVTRRNYDFQQPWITRMRNIQKNGIVIGDREILTTAEDLNDRTLVRIQKNGRGKWTNAQVKWIDYHADLAVVTSDDATVWQGLKVVELANPISPIEPMQIIRWRNGKMETRKAEFNQFIVSEGKMGFVEYLHFEVSSEINGAGWAEPVVSGNKIFGLTTSQSGNTCTVVLSSFVDSILKARRREAYTGLGYFAFTWQPAENLASLKHLKLQGEPRGVIIIDVPPTAEAGETLKVHDILLQVDGFDIDIQGDYQDPDYGPLSLENLATRNKWAGNQVQLKIWRDGQLKEISYRLPKADYSAKLVPDYVLDQEPEYLIVGGLVFQPLSNSYLRSWGEDWKRRSPFRLYYYNNEEPTKERPAVVFLSLVLADLYNLGYQDSRFLVVDKVNGRKVTRLPELREALQSPTNGCHLIEFVKGDSLQRLMIEASETEAATQRVLQRYGIAKDHVFTSATDEKDRATATSR